MVSTAMMDTFKGGLYIFKSFCFISVEWSFSWAISALFHSRSTVHTPLCCFYNYMSMLNIQRAMIASPDLSSLLMLWCSPHAFQMAELKRCCMIQQWKYRSELLNVQTEIKYPYTKRWHSIWMWNELMNDMTAGQCYWGLETWWDIVR